MKSNRTYQQKRIKNSPMRSPSPDYSSKNRNSSTSNLSLSQINIINNSNNASPVKFPQIPINVLKKNISNQTENIKPKNLLNGSNLQKLIRQNSDITPQVCTLKTNFIQTIQGQITQVFAKIQEIYSLLMNKKTNTMQRERKLTEENFGAQIELINKKLDQSIEQIVNTKRQQTAYETKHISTTNFDTFGHQNSMSKCRPNKQMMQNKLLESKYESYQKNTNKNHNNSLLIDSPISRMEQAQQDSSLSIFRINQLQSENNKLRREIIILKLQLEGNYKRNYSASKVNQTVNQKLKKSCNKSSIYIKKSRAQVLNNTPESHVKQQFNQQQSPSAYKFLKQKVTFLQNELQNKINRIAVVQKEKNQQIRLLKEKISNQSNGLEQQIQNFRKETQSQRKKITYLEQINSRQLQNQKSKNNQQLSSHQKRDQLNSKKLSAEDLLIRHRSRNFLDKQQILSLYDKSQQNFYQQSMYSEAEKINLEELCEGKKQIVYNIEKIKQYYEKIIAFNLNKYHTQLEKLQDQLRQLKEFIKNFNLESHQSHNKCLNCQQLNLVVLRKDLIINDLQSLVNILRQSIEQQKKKSQKLTQLLHKSGQAQMNKSGISERKFRRKGAFQRASAIKQKDFKSSGQINANQLNVLNDNSVIIKHTESVEGDFQLQMEQNKDNTI